MRWFTILPSLQRKSGKPGKTIWKFGFWKSVNLLIGWECIENLCTKSSLIVQKALSSLPKNLQKVSFRDNWIINCFWRHKSPRIGRKYTETFKHPPTPLHPVKWVVVFGVFAHNTSPRRRLSSTSHFWPIHHRLLVANSSFLTAFLWYNLVIYLPLGWLWGQRGLMKCCVHGQHENTPWEGCIIHIFPWNIMMDLFTFYTKLEKLLNKCRLVDISYLPPVGKYIKFCMTCVSLREIFNCIPKADFSSIWPYTSSHIIYKFTCDNKCETKTYKQSWSRVKKLIRWLKWKSRKRFVQVTLCFWFPFFKYFRSSIFITFLRLSQSLVNFKSQSTLCTQSVLGM